jgi:hypothetical protein
VAMSTGKGPSAAHSWRTLIGPRNWSGSAERRILGAVDDDWLVGGSSRMLLRLSGQGLVARVKIAAGA